MPGLVRLSRALGRVAGGRSWLQAGWPAAFSAAQVSAPRGVATGSHPLDELNKVKATAAGKLDVTEDEPGTGDMPHVTGRMREGVEVEFREPTPETVIELPSPEPPPQPGSGDSNALPRTTFASGPHEDTNADSEYGGSSLDYYGGVIPVVTDPVVGMASGCIVGASAELERKLGGAVIRGRGEDAVGVNVQPGKRWSGN
ncbi:hypothetical protein TSOC_001917 [Tetrabaena socialis]|uniref:Uncharacterized protein n=1 Tax=Tetrabaena socialis TaxID=47790 RepID=A0A2J8AFK0_9CHLO|nr:hypothetical protein TSOC_001917 [Tetrabaena socialis]|eukprot:PNH11297.1 hypothetical protein TSOC_001917 [Tetrabaena socialis]